MAQPAVPVNEDRTDLLGIPPFWAKPSINLPFLWESWIGQFFLAVGLKDNINPQDLLVEPAEVIDDPPPKREAVGPAEDAGEANARVLRDQAAVRRISELKVERDYTVERIKLYNSIIMLDSDTFSSFYARLSAQIALCN